MKTLVNNVQLIGNLGRDPEVKQVNGDRHMARMTLATTRTYTSKKSGEKVNDTQWHNLVAWGKTAEIAGKYLKKGARIAVGGELRSRSYDDPQGVKKYITEVLVNDFLMLGARKTA